MNELANLGSVLANHDPQNFYAVPAGYFEGLADQILNRIKALEANDAKDELSYLSPFLSKVSKEMPYEEMSRVLETSEGALKASYHHAVKKIEEYIKNH